MRFANKVLLTLLCLFLTFGINVSAKEGEFYEKNKAEFDKYKDSLSDDYIENFVKKYDSDTNSFNCGTFDMMCHTQAFTYSFCLGMAKTVSDQMKVIVRDPDDILKDPGINKYKGYLTSLANTLLPLFLTWHMMVMMMRRLGDPDDYPQAMNQKLLGVFMASILLALYNPMFNIIMRLQTSTLSGIIDSSVDQNALKVMLFTWSPGYSLIIVLFVLVAMLLFGLSVMYRFVALSFMFMVGPLAISTMLNDEFNYFSLWWKFIWNSFVTFALQAIVYAYCMQILTNQNAYVQNSPLALQPIIAISLVLVASFFSLTIPFLLGNLGSSSGTARSAGRVARIVLKR